MMQVAPCHGRLLGPMWTDLAEILRGRRARVWLQTMEISLGCVEVHEPQLINRQKPMIFAVSGPGLTDGVFDGFSIAALMFLDTSQ